MTTAIKGILVVAFVALPLAGCGVKSSPRQPDSRDYPRTYPAPETESGTGSYTGTGSQAQPAARRKDGSTYSPLGFPLEYPNRPAY